MAVAGAVPITQFTPAQQTQLRAGAKVGNYQVLNGHVMDLRTPQGQSLVATRTTNTAASAPLPTSPGLDWMHPSQDSRFTTPITSTPTPGGATSDAMDAEMAREAFEQRQLDAAKEQAAADKLSGQHDALGLLAQTFAQYGLPPEAADWAWSEIQAGKGMNEVTLDLYNPKTVGGQILHQYFPEIQARQDAGLAPMSPGDIVTWRNEARQMMRAAAMPEGFYDDNSDFKDMIVGNMSLKELGDRINIARDATYTMLPAERARFEQFGVAPGDGALTAYFFNPDKALPLLERDFNAAKIGGAADMTGYTGVSNDTARTLATAGVTADQARQGFGNLVNQTELFQGLPGQNEDNIDQQTQIGAQFLGNAKDQQQVEQRARTRVAAFKGGGGYDTSREGIGGLR